MKKSNKNTSKIIPNGRTLQTRDEYLISGKNYIKPGYEKKGNYRKVAVVDSNKNDELAVVKLLGKEKTGEPPKGTNISDYKKGGSNYKPYIETRDNKGKPIKIGKQFIENNSGSDVSKKDINNIKKDCVTNAKTGSRNKWLLRKLKNRKK